MSAAVVLAPIVEGHGEVEAVPLLLRRLVHRIDPACTIDVRRPIRVPRDKLLKEIELRRYVELASRSAGPGGAVILLLDADDDCPAELGPELLARASAVSGGTPLAVIVAMREFEGWFLATATSLRNKRGLPGDLEPPPDPENIRDAKGWLQSRRTDGFAYSPSTDQPALTAQMDLDQARARSESFDKLWRDVERLLRETGTQATPEVIVDKP